MIIPKLRIRITNLDSVVIKTPTRLLDDTSLPRVPVIRIFGSLETGGASPDSAPLSCNACVHIHQAYPYLFIEYTGSKDPSVGKLTTSSLSRAQPSSPAAHSKILCKVPQKCPKRSPRAALPPLRKHALRMALHPTHPPRQSRPLLRLPRLTFHVPQNPPLRPQMHAEHSHLPPLRRRARDKVRGVRGPSGLPTAVFV